MQCISVSAQLYFIFIKLSFWYKMIIKFATFFTILDDCFFVLKRLIMFFYFSKLFHVTELDFLLNLAGNSILCFNLKFKVKIQCDIFIAYIQIIQIIFILCSLMLVPIFLSILLNLQNFSNCPIDFKVTLLSYYF